MSGRLIVISGSSGSGKSTVIQRALATPGIKARLSVSATTRAPRPSERDAVDYYFVTARQFQDAIDRGELLEWAVFAGQFYGTPAPIVQNSLDAGECVVLEIEVQGALQVRDRCPNALLIWIDVPSFEILEERLRGRHTESEASITSRLEQAGWELSQAHQYHQRVLNDDLDRAVAELVTILRQHGCGD